MKKVLRSETLAPAVCKALGLDVAEVSDAEEIEDDA